MRGASTEGRGHDKVESGRRGKGGKGGKGGTRRRGKRLREGRRTPETMRDLFDGCGPRQSAYSSYPKVLKHFREGCALPKGTGTGGLRSQTLVFRPASGRTLPRPCAGRPAHFARVNEADVRRDPVRPGADGGRNRLLFFSLREVLVRFARCNKLFSAEIAYCCIFSDRLCRRSSCRFSGGETIPGHPVGRVRRESAGNAPARRQQVLHPERNQ